MSDAVKIALIVAIAPTLVSFAGVLAAMASLLASLRNRKKLEGIHIELNSRLTQLLELNGAKERAEGKAEGLVEGLEN